MCIDTSVFIKYLCPDEQQQSATNLITDALSRTAKLVAPSFAWAEIASVLRKKVRSNLLAAAEAEQIYAAYCNLPIDYIDKEDIRIRAWQIAERYGLLTLYDAAFLAVAETEAAEFWTTDKVVLNQLFPQPAYVHELGK
jgi:predicted nucleic acid-binding protein